MGFKIVASAPGKTILHGEHAVVFGKNAIAASVNLRTTVTVEFDQHNEVVLVAQNFDNNTLNWSLNELSELNFVTRDVNNRTPIYNEDEVKKLSRLLQKFDCDKFALDTARCFLFIFLNVCNLFNNSKPIGFTTRISSELPVGSGMGSSASFSVSLAAAILKAFEVTEISKELVCNWSYECEKIFHGTPSGIDNSICTNGGVILFKEKRIIDQLDALNGFKILLVHTGHSRNTKQLIKKISSIRDMIPSIMEKIIESIDLISIKQWDNLKENKNYEKMKTLITINQNLLNSIGAGHYSIDDIVNISSKFDLSAKLTGAGGGNTVLILLGPEDDEKKLTDLMNELEKKAINRGELI